MIIDTQVHILEKAHANDRGVRMHYTWHPMSAELLLDEMDYAGVDKCFFISYTARTSGRTWATPGTIRPRTASPRSISSTPCPATPIA